jgi:hypothetical protein
LRDVRASFLSMADQLADEGAGDDASWRATVADLDMVGGAGARVEAAQDELAQFVEAHRADPTASRYVVAVVWGLGWLAYLAHVRMTADDPLAQVVANTA